jgi:GT2 family glycosyltransferase
VDRQLDALIGSYDDEPGIPSFLSQYRNLLHHYVHQTSRREAGTFWGACGAIRRERFVALGGFDEAYSAACVEDIELGYRLRQAGGRIRLCKTLQVKHWKEWKPWTLLKTDFLYRALPWTRLILRRKHMENDLNLRTASRLSVTLAWLLPMLLLAGLLKPWALAAAGVCAAAMIALNWPLYRFFAKKRGAWFALRCIPWHWAYYFSGGLAFAVGWAQHVFQKPSPSAGGERSEAGAREGR